MMMDEHDERVSRWQEPILSIIKGLFRDGGRSMNGFEEKENTENCRFNLWTRKNAITPQALFVDDEVTLSGSNFNLSNPSILFVHGWRMNGHSDEGLLSLKNGKIKIYCDRNGLC
jgi:hypothetical protein